MLKKLLAPWRRWREKSRQYAIERALYKAGGGRRDARAGYHDGTGGAFGLGDGGAGGDGGGGD